MCEFPVSIRAATDCQSQKGQDALVVMTQQKHCSREEAQGLSVWSAVVSLTQDKLSRHRLVWAKSPEWWKVMAMYTGSPLRSLVQCGVLSLTL